MSWPSETECIRFVDVSRYQNADDYTLTVQGRGNDQVARARGRIDWPRFFEEFPMVTLVVARAAGSSSGIDPDFQYNYDEVLRCGRKAASYVNNNPTKTAGWMMENWWRPVHDGRRPPIVYHDCESDSGLGDTPANDITITTGIRAELFALRTTFPRVDIYTADWFWTPRVTHGWESGEQLWGAHYVYLTRNADGSWRVAYTFAEADAAMPYASATFPRLPQGFPLANFNAWQLSSKGPPAHTVDGRLTGSIDLNYMKKAYFDVAFGVQLPTPTIEERVARLEAMHSTGPHP